MIYGGRHYAVKMIFRYPVQGSVVSVWHHFTASCPMRPYDDRVVFGLTMYALKPEVGILHKAICLICYRWQLSVVSYVADRHSI